MDVHTSTCVEYSLLNLQCFTPAFYEPLPAKAINHFKIGIYPKVTIIYRYIFCDFGIIIILQVLNFAIFTCD